MQIRALFIISFSFFALWAGLIFVGIQKSHDLVDRISTLENELEGRRLELVRAVHQRARQQRLWLVDESFGVVSDPLREKLIGDLDRILAMKFAQAVDFEDGAGILRLVNEEILRLRSTNNHQIDRQKWQEFELADRMVDEARRNYMEIALEKNRLLRHPLVRWFGAKHILRAPEFRI